ncbi:MAG: stage III sporulation protein AB [Oscillospiraceae bacterium]|jgi:stage III sporulation protein AB|nr:stage III sporulation protein AB [Oscillospiraceae bacterium]
MRWIGAILVAGGASAISLAAVQNLGARVRLLAALTDALELMRAELQFNLTPLPALMEVLADRAPTPARAFFARCARLMTLLGEHSFQALWNKALTETEGAWLPPERELMATLGGLLGRYDAEAQGRAVSYVRERMEALRRCAEEKRIRQSRVYGALGLASGLAVVIILL